MCAWVLNSLNAQRRLNTGWRRPPCRAPGAVMAYTLRLCCPVCGRSIACPACAVS